MDDWNGKLSNSFLKKYKNKEPNFGFNGLGWLVFKRTYSRKVEGENRTEEWWETIKRCIEGSQFIGADYTKEEAERLYDYMFNLKCLFGGRMLWQFGTKMVEKFKANSLLNCRSGDTNVLTRQGWKRIKNLNGKVVELVTDNGKWIKAPIKSFGKQKLLKVIFKGNNGNEETIYATPNHEWIVIDKPNNKRVKTKTINLSEGQKVPVVRGKNSTKDLSPQGIQHGLVFGDGSRNGYESTIDLFGNTRKYCEKYFNLNRIITTLKVDNGIRYGGMPNYFKDKPNINENKTYLSGFLAGWIAADGSVNKHNGCTRLFSSIKENILFGKDVAAVLGYRTSKPRLERSHNPYDKEDNNSTLWSITFYKSDNPQHLLIREDHKSKTTLFNRKYDNWMKIVSVESTQKEEEVFCAQVPKTHSFVINGNILTGNCWGIIMNTPKAFSFLFENLMLGGGVGFSVRKEDVYELPRIQNDVIITHENSKDADFIVPDSREGWISLLDKVLESFFYTGKSFTYSTILIRPAGEPIKGFGGTSSGPKILVEGITKINNVIKNRYGKKLRSIDVLDINNILGSIVVAGNIRRSALLALGDPDDYAFLRAKRWDLGNIPNWRAMSNNTICFDDYSQTTPSLWEGFKGNGEPYGFFNVNLSQKYGRLIDGELKNCEMYPTNKDQCTVTNPCAEISLDNWESCNLCELCLNRIETKDELIDCAKLLYKTQKAIAAMDFLHKETNEIVHKNMRLGLGVTGICQSIDKLDWLDECYKELRKFDKVWSKKKSYPESVKLTTVKPSGSLSLLAGATPGIHPAFSRYYIRRIRMSSSDKLVDKCREAGLNVEYAKNFDGSDDRDMLVAEFVCDSGNNVLLAKDMKAVDQLELVKKLQSIWSDNAVSVTVYYKKEELSEIQEWLKKYYKNNIKSVSFLLHSDHGFVQAPYEEISKEEYESRIAKINFSFNEKIEVSDDSLLEGLECETGACPIR